MERPLPNMNAEKTKTVIPSKLIKSFIKESKNKVNETIAVIVGKYNTENQCNIANQIVFPPQINNTPTYCEITDDGKLWTYLNQPENEGSQVLALIHSHPSPLSAIPSSLDCHILRDLVMAYGPSIASIIIGEKNKECLAYTLTEEGLKRVMKCENGPCKHERGATFVYKYAENIGYDKNPEFEAKTVDLRKG